MRIIVFVFAFLIASISLSQQQSERSLKIKKAEGLSKIATKVRPDFLLGSFASGLTTTDGEVLKKLFRNEFNILTIGVYMKPTQPQPQTFRLDNYDELVNYAWKNNISIYLHPLIGGNQYTADWVINGNFTAQELRNIMRERITTILTRHGDKIMYADVVNEALNGLNPDGSINWQTKNHVWLNMGWYDGKKYRLPDYLVEAFRIAREVGHKDLKLILNHPCNDTPDGRITEATLRVYEMMKYEGIPVDGIGFQMHIRLLPDGTITNNCNNPWTREGFETILKRYEEAGIEVHITEFDVHIKGQPASKEHLDIQAKIYSDALEAAIKSPAVRSFKTWGFTDKYSWHEGGIDGTPLLFDSSFEPKPAYRAQVQMLKDLKKQKK